MNDLGEKRELRVEWWCFSLWKKTDTTEIDYLCDAYWLEKRKKENTDEFNHNGNMLILENQFKDTDSFACHLFRFLNAFAVFFTKPPYNPPLPYTHTISSSSSIHNSAMPFATHSSR